MISFIRNNPLSAAILAVISIIGWTYIFGLHFAVRVPLQKPACINNLRMLQNGKTQWALETHRTNGVPPVIYEINQYVKGGRPTCPKGGTYIYGNVGELPRCTFPGHKNLLSENP